MKDPETDYPTNVFSQVIILLEDLADEVLQHIEYLTNNIKGE